MVAEILDFPAVLNRRAPPHKPQQLLANSWDEKFFNPYLNAIYNGDIPYIERWYLETKHALLNETKSNLLNQILLDKEFCKEFITAIDTDLAICVDLLHDTHYCISAEQCIKKLRLWRKNFLYCFNQ